MNIEELLAKFKEERDRAQRDADKSTSQEDLDYHNGEVDGLGWAIYILEGQN